MTLIVDPGACDIVLDPADLFRYPLIGTNESRRGETRFIALGHPILHFGEKKATVYTNDGVPRTFRHTVCECVKTIVVRSKGD